ncbi:hypothetical protein [Aestuariispira insulae]|nr:hypothetical protein [Aestuariispira insulae]
MIKKFGYLSISPLLVLAGGLYFGILPQLSPDSNSYMNFSGARTAGYPIFLKFFELLGGLSAVVIAQYGIAAIAGIYLSQAIKSFSGSRLIAAAAAALAIGNPVCLKFHNQILTESLFYSLLLIILGSLVAIFSHQKRSSIWVFSLAIGASLFVRPTAFAYLPLMVILLGLGWDGLKGRRRAFIATAIFFPVLFLFGDHASFRIVHGDQPRGSLAPLHLFAKASMIDSNTQNPFARDNPRWALWQEMEDGYAPTRQFVQQAPSLTSRAFMSPFFEVFAQYQFARAEINLSAQQAGTTPHEIMVDVARKRLAANPSGYLGNAALNYYALWTIFKGSYPTQVEELKTYFAETPVPESKGKKTVFPLADQPSKISIIARPVLWGFWFLTTVICIIGLYLLWRRQLTPLWRVQILLSLMIHGNFALIALTGVGIPRYTMTMWPAMAVIAVLSLIPVWKFLSEVRRR